MPNAKYQGTPDFAAVARFTSALLAHRRHQCDSAIETRAKRGDHSQALPISRLMEISPAWEAAERSAWSSPVWPMDTP